MLATLAESGTLYTMEYQKKLQVSTQQVLVEDNSVFSIQWTDVPMADCQGLDVGKVYTCYLEAIRYFTLGIIRPLESDAGVAFRLFGRLPLLCFLPPECTMDADCEQIALRICGGILVQKAQCDRGEMLFRLSNPTTQICRISLTLRDYCPLLLGSLQPTRIRRWLYRFTQAALHQLVTAHFLGFLYRRRMGGKKKVVMQHVFVRDGRRT